MKMHFTLLFLLLSFTGIGQDTKFLATATTNENIINYVHSVDSTIVLIDFLELKKKSRKEAFEKVSGLILSGGRDVNPKNYSAKDTFDLCVTDDKRDEVELFLIKSALRDSIPILGICRGHQILNVGLGGNLYQDIPTQYSSDTTIIHRDSLLESYVYHDILVDTTSMLYRIYRKADLEVNSFHHQAVKKKAEQMRIVARSPDGICEASEWSKGLQDRWIISVQYHPERLYTKSSEHSRLIKAFISACFP